MPIRVGLRSSCRIGSVDLQVLGTAAFSRTKLLRTAECELEETVIDAVYLSSTTAPPSSLWSRYTRASSSRVMRKRKNRGTIYAKRGPAAGMIHPADPGGRWKTFFFGDRRVFTRAGPLRGSSPFPALRISNRGREFLIVFPTVRELFLVIVYFSGQPRPRTKSAALASFYLPPCHLRFESKSVSQVCLVPSVSASTFPRLSPCFSFFVFPSGTDRCLGTTGAFPDQVLRGSLKNRSSKRVRLPSFLPRLPRNTKPFC